MSARTNGKRASTFAALALLASAERALAEPVAIANAGFEDLYLGSNLPPEYGGDVPTGTFPVGPAPAGWTSYYALGAPAGGEFIGVLNPGTAADHAPNPAYFPAGAPEGDNVVLLYMDGDAGGQEYGVEQTLGANLEADRVYTLTAQVGNIASGTALLPPYSTFGFFDLDGFPGYRLQLLAGGVVVAEDTTSVSPAEGIFEQATVQLTTDASHAQLGQPLGVRLVTRNLPEVPGVSGIEVDFDDVRLDVGPVPAVPVLPVVAWCVLALALATLGSRVALREAPGRRDVH